MKNRRGMNDLISVIVPIFNVAEYLEQCIESIIAQTYSNLEIVLVDDGSTDGGSDICDKYSKLDSRVITLHKKNEGLVRARKEGLSRASAQIISYVDGDDWIEPNMIEVLFEKLVSEDVDIVACGRIEDTEGTEKKVLQGVPIGKYDKASMGEKIYPVMIENNHFFEWGILPNLWDKMFRREVLETAQQGVEDSLKMGEDAACVYPCLLAADSIYILEECLYHYRQIPTSMVKANENKQVERNNYRLLYRSISEQLRGVNKMYQLERQWTDYLLFLMTPRADSLYLGIEELDYLFPFPKVAKGSSVIIYGMGVYGQRLYRFLKKSGFCEVVAAVDMNYEAISRQGIEVSSPKTINEVRCDDIVVAMSFYHSRNKVGDHLKKMYPLKNIHIMDESVIRSTDTLAAFGLE